jgi:pimeloyl-ACP methyl ester carboxylesterase
MSDVADDVARYMWENKISTATLAGHGFGAKVALAAGCYYAEKTTGIFSIDGGPLDHRFYESFREMREYVRRLREINLRGSRADAEAFLKSEIKVKHLF